MPERRRVAILVETSGSFGRGVLRGVSRFVFEHEPWSMFLEPRELTSAPPNWLATWKGDGILARVSNARIARAVVRSGVPAVNLCSALSSTQLPCIESDPHAQVKLALQHLIERGLRTFAYLGDPFRMGDWSGRIGAAFEKIVRSAGFMCHGFDVSRPPGPWDREQQRLGRWIAGLPKPVGVLAIDDVRGRQLIDACQRVSVEVPDEVAVMGIENDELVCMISDPPLTSVIQNAEKSGYEAAALLQRMMDGAAAPRGVIHIEPLGVAVRRSTDTLAHQDPVLSGAVRFIREHACDGAGVAELSRHLGISRSTLDRKMIEAIGRSPHGEIIRVRLERAKELLVQTDLKLLAVAHKAGFKHTEYMGVVFRKRLGMTPGEYRKATQRKAQLFGNDD